MCPALCRLLRELEEGVGSLCPGTWWGRLLILGSMRSTASCGPQLGLEGPQSEHPEPASGLRQERKCAQRRGHSRRDARPSSGWASSSRSKCIGSISWMTHEMWRGE